MAEYLLGVDSGTTACKSIVFDVEGHSISGASAEYGIRHPKPTWAEQDPDWWWNAAVQTVREALSKARISGKEIVGIGVDSQREAVVPLDSEGRKLADSIIWLDRRTIPQAEKIKRLIPVSEVIETTGVPIDYIFSASKILWIKEETPRIFERAKHFLCAKDYIVYRLTGEIITDYSMASRTMLFDTNKRKWSENLCETLGIPVEMLPPIKGSWEIVGEVTAEAQKLTGLAKGTPVVGGGGDRPCEAVGSAVVEPSYVNIGTGTGTAITTPLAEPKVDGSGRIDCCCHVVPNTWQYEIVIMTTGASLRWFRDTFGREEIDKGERTSVDPYIYLDELAEQVDPGSDKLFYYPYPMGARAPKFNDLAKGVFFGFTLGHTKAHFIRAVLEGVAFQYKETVDILKTLNLNVLEASMVGGETKSHLWNQIKTDIMGERIKIPEVADAAALGSAILAGVGTGIYKDIKSATKRAVRFKRVYKPGRKSREKYAEFYEKYKKVYESLEKAYRVVA